MSALLPILIPVSDFIFRPFDALIYESLKCSLLQATKHVLEVREALGAFEADGRCRFAGKVTDPDSRSIRNGMQSGQ